MTDTTTTDALVERYLIYLRDLAAGRTETILPAVVGKVADTIAAQAADMDAMAEAALRNEDFKQKQAARIEALKAALRRLVISYGPLHPSDEAEVNRALKGTS